MTPPSPEHRAFLRAICESPECDLPRLVYADFLEENAGAVACGECKGTGKGEKWSEFEGNWFPILCSHCSGSGRVSNGTAEQAESIRWMIDHPEVHWVCLCEQRPGEVCYSCRHIPGARDIPRRAAPGIFWETPYVVHRGFVSEIRCTLAQFVGGQCLCGTWPRETWNCTACHGVGRLPGIAAAVFAEHPVTKVVLVGREPMEGLSGNWFWRSFTARHYGPECLPPEIMMAGTRQPDYKPAGQLEVAFQTRELALDWASDRAVAYGRSLAWPDLAPLQMTLQNTG